MLKTWVLKQDIAQNIIYRLSPVAILFLDSKKIPHAGIRLIPTQELSKMMNHS